MERTNLSCGGKQLFDLPHYSIGSENLMASPDTLRIIAATLREQDIVYQIIRVDFNTYNHFWKGKRGLVLQIPREDYIKYIN